METVIATTTVPHAEHMQQTLVGHTMSGEALERRPQVQFTGALDFLEAASRIYEITAVRLAPSGKSPELLDVIAEYRPMVWHCEACGNECGYPGQLLVVRTHEYHCWCSPVCRKHVEALVASTMHSARAELGDPVEFIIHYVFTHNTLRLPMKLHRLLTEAELRAASNHIWRVGRQGLFTALLERTAALGVSDLPSVPRLESPPIEKPRWVKTANQHEYWQGEKRLGFVFLADMEWARDTPWWHKDTYWCMIDRQCEPPLCLGSIHPIRAAKRRVEDNLRQTEASEAFWTEIRNYRALVFQLEWEEYVPCIRVADE
jgi:hypothetical protein